MYILYWLYTTYLYTHTYTTQTAIGCWSDPLKMKRWSSQKMRTAKADGPCRSHSSSNRPGHGVECSKITQWMGMTFHEPILKHSHHSKTFVQQLSSSILTQPPLCTPSPPRWGQWLFQDFDFVRGLAKPAPGGKTSSMQPTAFVLDTGHLRHTLTVTDPTSTETMLDERFWHNEVNWNKT